MTSDIPKIDHQDRQAVKLTSGPDGDIYRLVEDYMRRDFSILPLIGGIYGYFSTPRWSALTYSLYVMMYTCVGLTSLDLLYSSYILRNNMTQFTLAFHVFLIGCVVMTASVSLTLQRKNMAEFFYEVEFSWDWAEYQNCELYQNLVALSRQRILRLMATFLLSYSTVSTFAVTFPFVDMYLGNDEHVTNATGIYWKGLPFAMWWPFDAHNSIISWISCFICQGLMATFAPNMCTSAIIFCFLGCEQLLNQMKLLTYAIDQLDQRATAMFKKKYNQEPHDDLKNEFDECYYECISQNVKHHHKILDYVARLMRLANYAIAVPFFGGAMLLGLAGLNLLSDDDPRLSPKMILASAGTTEAINMFLLCVYGEKFASQSEELFNSVIRTKWYKRSLKCRKALLILQCGSLRPVKMTAAKMIVLNMGTFANLVNSAYSIFNLRSVASAGK